MLVWSAPIRDLYGEITQVMEMSTDITEIRRLQDHLTSLGFMLGSMSHGVKGMLTAPGRAEFTDLNQDCARMIRNG